MDKISEKVWGAIQYWREKMIKVHYSPASYYLGCSVVSGLGALLIFWLGGIPFAVPAILTFFFFGMAVFMIEEEADGEGS